MPSDSSGNNTHIIQLPKQTHIVVSAPPAIKHSSKLMEDLAEKITDSNKLTITELNKVFEAIDINTQILHNKIETLETQLNTTTSTIRSNDNDIEQNMKEINRIHMLICQDNPPSDWVTKGWDCAGAMAGGHCEENKYYCAETCGYCTPYCKDNPPSSWAANGWTCSGLKTNELCAGNEEHCARTCGACTPGEAINNGWNSP